MDIYEDDDSGACFQNLFYGEEPNTKFKNPEKQSLRELIAVPFSYLFFPNNILAHNSNLQKDINNSNLSKFKEINIAKVKEDMLYYCSPVDILAKIENKNSDYLIESKMDFVKDLGIISFFDNEEINLERFNTKIEGKNASIAKKFALEDWNEQLKTINKESENFKDIINKTNEILKLIQNIMKIFTTKDMDTNKIEEKLNEIISNLNKNEINLDNIGFEMNIILEENLLFLFGLISKFYGKDEKQMAKFVEKYIQIFNIIKSNRIFFVVVQYLYKNQNLVQYINIEKPIETLSDKFIDMKAIINFIQKYYTEDILILPNLSVNYNSLKEKKENKNISNDNFWVVNNKEELCVFNISNNKPKTKLLFYRINLRIEEESIKIDNNNSVKDVDGSFRFLDFGEIDLTNNDEDEILDINISIKNDLIYICYFINRKLKNSDTSKESEFIFSYKIYTNTMLFLKEEIIKNENFKYQKSFLYSDKNNIFVITDENKIFWMKKEYSMNNFVMSDLSIKCENKDISITNYRYYNCFNLENILILENKNDMNDLLLVQIYQENNKFIFNLYESKQNIEQDKYRYKISYNEDINMIIKKDDKKIYLMYNLFFQNNIAEFGFPILPFDSNLKKDLIKLDVKSDAYKSLLKEYAYYIKLYGNFDLTPTSESFLRKYPFSFCFNININNLKFIIEQILNIKDNENIYYYIIILKQFICCMYNANLFDIKLFDKIFSYLKNFILNIKKTDNKYKTKILKEIIYISSYLNDSNIIEISEVKKIIEEKSDNYEKDLKINLYLMDLLLSQPKTQLNNEVFDIILEFDKNFLLKIFGGIKDSKIENKIISSYYKLYKNLMTKTMALLYHNYKNNNNEKYLFNKKNKISSDIVHICELYKNINTKIGKLSFLFNSINFSLFYLIIQKKLVNKNSFDDFSDLYKVLLTLDSLNINKNYKNSEDSMNLIEITNSKNESEIKENEESLKKCFNIINFKTKQNITFKSNFINYVGCVSLRSYFEKIILIRKDINNNEIEEELDINHCIDQIFYDVYGIKIFFEEELNYKWQTILDIIPIKDVKEFLEEKKNENYMIINSIQKSLLYYFLFLLKNNINKKLNEFLKNSLIKNFSKLYHNEFLQFIYTNEVELDKNLLEDKKEIKTSTKEENKENKEDKVDNIIKEINNFINGLKNLFYLNKDKKEKEKEKDKKIDKNDLNNVNLIMELLNKIITFFGDFNKKNKESKINFENYYDKNDITIEQIKSYKDINLEDKLYAKLFEQLEKDISKKNRIISSIKSNEQIKKMILKIFQIIIKYYNYNSKFLDLIEINDFSAQNEDYNLFLDIYEKCCQMKLVYNQEKSRFVDEKFEEQSENYFKVTNDKLNFIYKIIVPSFNENLKYDKSIVQNLIELIKNKHFEPKVILKYSEFQNIHCTLKVIELLIINNLLFNLNDEENIKFVLHTINDLYNKNKENNKYSISMSLLDSIYGADFSKMQQVKTQFHLLIEIILEKYINNPNNNANLGIITKILLYQSLLWKYKGRDFNIMPKILGCFDDLKKGESYYDKIIFELQHERVFRINKYDLESLKDIKFEIFKIISSQIFLKIKDNLENNNIIQEQNVELNLKRTISKIDNTESILNLLMSYFLDIQKNNKYYHDLIIFFYKNIINSQKLIDSMNAETYTNFIIKIFKIIFEENDSLKGDNINMKRNYYTKFIILKLFLQILENTDNDIKIMNLTECCLEYDQNAFNGKENPEEESNPFDYLISKFNLLLNKEENLFLKYYYLKIFLFCLNKIDQSKIKNKNDLLNLNFLLSLNENISQFESRFYNKNQTVNKFEEISLFSNTQNLKQVKLGTLLCYMQNKYSFEDYLKDGDKTYFDYNELIYNVEQIQNSERIYAIMDESLDGKNISKIKNLESKSLKSIVFISDKNNNLFYNKYLEKNSVNIYNKLISQLMENKLNYKGINYILKMIYILLDYIKIENAENILQYIFKYINDDDVKKNNEEWNMCSYEYFENEMNSFKNIFYLSNFDINNELKSQKTKDKENDEKNKLYEKAPLLLSSLFNYKINNNKDFYIEYKNNNNINKSFRNELKLLNNIIKKEKEENSEKVIKTTNLSFYKSNEDNTSTLITDDSILLIKKIRPEKELLDILSKNSGKIKSIITSAIDDSNKDEYNQFIPKIEKSIYLCSESFYKKLEEFFIKGKGGNYVNTDKKINKEESDIISIYYPNQFKKYDYLINETYDREYNKFYLDEDKGLDSLFNDIFLNENEIKELDKIKNKELLSEYEENIQKKVNEINFDLNKVFCLQNIKLCYRILYVLLKKENIIKKLNTDFLYKNMNQIMEIFDYLCKEYYYNINENLPVNELQNLLKDFLNSLNKLENFGKKWSQNCIEYISKILNNLKEEDNNSKDKNEQIYLNKCKEYDKILFFLNNCNDSINQMVVDICFEIINNIMKNMITENKSNVFKKNSIDKEYISYFLEQWMKSIYDIIINNKPNSKLFINYFISNDKFNKSILDFINEVIEIKKYFVKEGKYDASKIPKYKTLLVQFGFKYLDICFYIFFKEKQYNLIKYWIESFNDYFYFYSSYKILATDKHYEELDIKELFSIIAYISDSISCFKKGGNTVNQKNKEIQMKINEFNKVELNNKNDLNNFINITSFSLDKIDNKNKFNKLAIFTHNKNSDTYYLQDIIDTANNNSIYLMNNYKQSFNNENIFLVPLNEFSTSLYSFGSNFNHSLGINGKLAKYYDIPTKCEGLPDDIWEIGYGNNYCLALSEKNKKIYACGCNKGGGFNSTPRASFTDETRINKNKDSDNINKFISFATGNCDSTLLQDENGELYGIGNNEEKIFGLENDLQIKYPKKLENKIYEENEDEEEPNEEEKEKENTKKIEKENIKKFYIGYKNSYLIDDKGQLYGIGNNEYCQISSNSNKIVYNNWKKIELPENCTKFIDVAVGENYIICLIEDNEGNNKLYARGKNYDNQCGISGENKIRYLTMCDNTKNLNFKKIYTRNNEFAAITIDGNLYVLKNKKLTLVLFNDKKNNNNENNSNEILNEINEESQMNDKKIIVDDVAICKSHMLIIARQYDKEKGTYIKKLFGCGNNSRGALGLPINSNKESNNYDSIKEIPLFNENKKKLTPIKLTIGDNKSYVLCINEEDLIKNIKEKKMKDNELNCSINMTNISIEKIESNILNFYYSKNVDLFINIFKSITAKAMSNFIEAMDEIKMNKQDLIDKGITFSINFPMFYDYLSKHQEIDELSRIFIQTNNSNNNLTLSLGAKPELECIFKYLKTKSNYISNDLFKYCETNEISEYKQFLQKAIGNNLLYLNAKNRLEKFNELFSKLNRKYGTERRVDVDRFKANIFYDKFNENPKNKIPDIDLNQTIFGQVFQNFGKTKGEDFLIRKDKRLFIVALKNEHATDSGGPYHEVISGMCHDLQSDYLNMFIKTPNHKHDVGLLRDKYIPNPDAKREVIEQGYEFLGKLMASAIASGEVLDLNLHPVVWKALLGNEITFYEYESIDSIYFSLLNNLENELKIIENKDKEKEKEKKDENIISTAKENLDIKTEDIENFNEKYNLNFVIKNSNGTDIILKPEGDKIMVTLENLKEYITLSKKMRTSEFASQIEFIKKGFNSVIPSSIFQHLYWRQLEELVCGKTRLDIGAFMENTEYDGFTKDSDVIKWFWNWLSKCTEHEQSLYLKFVSGRTRLPKDKNFKYTHVIVKNTYYGSEAFPNSATCFFTLKLPVYKDRETLEKKMKYAIKNCDEIDGDN